MFSQFRKFLDEHPGQNGSGLSDKNKKTILKKVSALANGDGLHRPNEKEPSFKVGVKIALDQVDVDALKAEAEAWDPNDKTGWTWKHEIGYIAKYQRFLRGEPEPKSQPKSAGTKRATTTDEGGDKKRVAKTNPKGDGVTAARVQTSLLVSEDGSTTVRIKIVSQNPVLKGMMENVSRLEKEQDKDEAEITSIDEKINALDEKIKALRERKTKTLRRVERRGDEITPLRAAIAAYANAV